MNDNTSQTDKPDLDAAARSTTAHNARVSWDAWLRRTTFVIARLGVAFLFFSQLFWKLPPHFGCPDGPFAFSAAGPDGVVKRSTSLCDWIGIESVWSQRERSFFAIDFNNDGKPDFALHLKPLVRANGWFIDHVVIPHFQFFGWLIFLAEAFIVVSLALGIFARLGALFSLLLSVQLMIGVAGVSDFTIGLYEWEWSYHLMILVSLVLWGAAAGRVFGLDALLRPRLIAAAGKGNRLSRLLLAFT